MRSTDKPTELPEVVPLYVLAGQLGYGDQSIAELLQHHRAKPVEGRPWDAWLSADPPTEPVLGLPVEDAKRFLPKARSDIEDHRSRWEAYVAYRDAKKREAVAKREQDYADSMRRAREHAQRVADADAERQRMKAAEELAHRVAQEAERQGQPVSFEEFAKGAV